MFQTSLEERADEMKKRMKSQRNVKRARNFKRGNARIEIPRSRFRWSRRDLEMMLKPVVYIFWGWARFGERVPLYIGKSEAGISRALSKTHHMAKIRKQSYEIEFIICLSDDDACAIERRLIRELKPDHNGCFYETPSCANP